MGLQGFSIYVCTLLIYFSLQLLLFIEGGLQFQLYC